MRFPRSMQKVLCMGSALLALAAPVCAQKTPEAEKPVVIRAGRVLDVRTGRVLREQDIIVSAGVITAIKPASAGAEESGTVIDLSHATVLPGLIDAHKHITGDPSISDVDKLGISEARRALKGARNARVTIEAGFTTIRNVGADGYPDVALRDAINDGDVVGPRILASGPAITIDGGSCDNIRMAYERHYTSPGVADGVEGVQHKVREVVKYGADVVDVCDRGALVTHGSRRPAIQHGGDAGHCCRSPPTRPPGRSTCSWSRGSAAGLRSGRGLRGTWLSHGRRSHCDFEKERDIPGSDCLCR